MHTQIRNESVNQVMSSAFLKRPRHKESTEEFIKILQEAMLGVIICLPPPSPPCQSSTGEKKDDSTSVQEKQFGDKPIPIGHMSLNEWRGAHLRHNRDVSLGISLASEYRGQGYGREAINWALDWAFQFGGVHRVNLTGHSYNHNALKLYRGMGFVEEGRQREAVYCFHGWHDVILFSMLDHEWEKLRGITRP